MEDYTVDFCKWSADTGWNEVALKYQYHQGLSELLKDELARVEPISAYTVGAWATSSAIALSVPVSHLHRSQVAATSPTHLVLPVSLQVG